MPRTPRLAVLASGSGTTLQAILDDAHLGSRVVVVGTDRPDCAALARARRHGVDTFATPLTDYADRRSWNRALEKTLTSHAPDLVVLAGFMRVLDPGVVSRFRIVNTHPALLPHFPGAHAIRDALGAGATSTGVTVHWVDEGVDTGQVIAQQAVPVEPGDTEDTLRARVQAVEKPLYVNTLTQLIQEME